MSKPSATSARRTGMAVAVTAASGLLEQRRDGPERLPRGEAPVTDPRPVRRPRCRARTVKPSPPPCRSWMTVRIGRAGPPMPLLGYVRGARPGDVEQGVVVVLGQPGTRPQSGVRRSAPSRRPPGRGGRRGRSRGVVVRSGAGERPPRTRCAPLRGGEVGQPRRIQVLVPGRPAPARRRPRPRARRTRPGPGRRAGPPTRRGRSRRATTSRRRARSARRGSPSCR